MWCRVRWSKRSSGGTRCAEAAAREAWLRRIVVNRAYSHLRRRRFWNAIGAVLRVAEEEVAPPPDEAAEQREHQARPSVALERLSARQSLAFTFRGRG